MPKSVEVKARAPKVDKDAVITLSCFGETLDEDIQLVGAEVIKSNYEANAIITVQGGIRRMLETGSDVAAIQEAFSTHKPGTAVRRGVDVKGGYMAYFAGLSSEEKKAELAKLRAMDAPAK